MLKLGSQIVSLQYRLWICWSMWVTWWLLLRTVANTSSIYFPGLQQFLMLKKNLDFSSSSSFTQEVKQPKPKDAIINNAKKKIIMSLTFTNKTRKQTTESQATVKQCLGLVQSLLSVWKGRVISANAQARPAYKYRGARRALPPKPPPAQVPQSSSGLLFVMTKQLNR